MVFLVENEFMTGQHVYVDGGYTGAVRPKAARTASEKYQGSRGHAPAGALLVEGGGRRVRDEHS